MIEVIHFYISSFTVIMLYCISFNENLSLFSNVWYKLVMCFAVPGLLHV